MTRPAIFKMMNGNLGLLAIASFLCLGCNVESTTELTLSPQPSVVGDAEQERHANEVSDANTQRIPIGSQEAGTLKVPILKSSPKYCLFEFGLACERKIWLVADGTTIYVDRNSNGNLTESGERLAESNREESVGYREGTYKPIELQLSDIESEKTELEIGWYQRKDEPIHHFMKVRTGGVVRQYAGWREMFSDSQATSRVFKFGGKYTPIPLRTKQLYLEGDAQELHLAFTIIGEDQRDKTCLSIDAVPEEITPVAEIRWPAIESTEPIKTMVNLTSRC